MYNPQYWRRRAEEMRRIASDISTLNRAQYSLLRIADEYDRLALQAEERRQLRPAHG
jgi:hypothetical protein